MTNYQNSEDLTVSSTLTTSNSNWYDPQPSVLPVVSDLWASPQPIPVVASRFQPAAPPPASQPLPPSPPPWHENYSHRPRDLPTTRQTIRRDNRLLTSASLPVFSAPNCRSIFPKIRNILEDMRLRGVTCLLGSESWEQESSKAFQKEVERMVELEGLAMISKPRKYRRGGGVCIIADTTKVTISPLDIPSGNLEIVWALVKPIQESIIKEILVFCF